VLAVLCKEFGPPTSLVVEEVADPEPGPLEVVIDVEAAGVSFPDTLIIENKYQIKPELPFSPGAEVAGTVSMLGSQVHGVTLGSRVMAFLPYGAFAERVAARAGRLVEIPAGVDMMTAASLLMNYGTAFHGLRDRGRLQEGETLLVLGAAGGVGLAAVELGATVGANVIAAASSDEKLELCRERGAQGLLNYSNGDVRGAVRSVTKGNGVDVIFDPVGGELSETVFREIAWGGRLLVVGFASGTIPRLPFNLPLLKGASIVGVFWGSFIEREPGQHQDNTQALLELLGSGKIRPYVSGRFSLADVPKALEQVADRRALGKLVVTTNSTDARSGRR
jgi:NADPH:quinone reductase